MSEEIGSLVEVKFNIQTETRIHVEGRAYEQDNEQDHEVVGDLARDFEAGLKRALHGVNRSIEEIEAEALLASSSTLGQDGHSSGLIAAISKLFAHDPAKAAERKLADLRSIKSVAVVLESVADNFPAEYDLYRHAVGTLNTALENHRPYQTYLVGLDQAAGLRGVDRDQMKALLHDPFVQSEDVKSLRASLNAVIFSPEISPLFQQVEERYHTINRMMSDVASGAKWFDAKGVEMSEFRPLSDIAERMAKNVERPEVSRPGGPAMDAPENTISESMKKISENIRIAIERMINSVRSAFSPPGPSV